MPKMRPPRLAQSLLRALLPPDQQAAVLGDMEELFHAEAKRRGPLAARLGYWAESLRSAPSFFVAMLQNPTQWRHVMNNNSLIRMGWKSALLSVLFLLPALVLVASGLLFQLGAPATPLSLPILPGWIDNPWTVLGGLALAAGINLAVVMRARVQSTDESLSAALEIKKSGWNLLVLGVAGLAGLVILLYLIVENLVL